MRQTRPAPVVPSPVQRLPSRSNAMPLVPGTPVAKALAVGIDAHAGAVESSESQPVASGATFHSVPVPAPSATYRLPSRSKVMPDGLHPVGFGMNATVTREPLGPMRQIGHFLVVSVWRPVVYRLPAASPV